MKKYFAFMLTFSLSFHFLAASAKNVDILTTNGVGLPVSVSVTEQPFASDPHTFH